jgi:ribonuclease HI
MLENEIGQYKVKSSVKEDFEKEIENWIVEGWLKEYDGEHEGVLPLMAVVQVNKEKVRPVLDYRELNQYVSSHTGESEVCGEKLRRWRRLGGNVKILDLRKAYLQLHLTENLWKYQVVKYKKKTYCLTRLGFGLNVAPKIMSAVLTKVLSLDPDIKSGTDSYIDDIVVNEDIVSSESVMCHLRKYGLQCKPAESLIGGRVLGLRVGLEENELVWSRDNHVEIVPDGMTKRGLFSTCGKLIGHYPVAGWLRPACSFVKRKTNGLKWNDNVDQETASMLKCLLAEVKTNDPVKGRWLVPDVRHGRVWCDASSLAIGVGLEVGGNMVEDASWLRKEKDPTHINLAELESVIKGVNLALKWDLTELEIVTDSATVFGWMKSMLTNDRRIRTRGLGEALVHRRLTLLKAIIEEYGMKVNMVMVKSSFNLADKLTRVPKRWLASNRTEGVVAIAQESEENLQAAIERIHGLHHLGVNRTWYVLKQCYPELEVKREEVVKVVKHCLRCKEIDPAPLKYDKGTLEVAIEWDRVACDVTHYGSQKYLTLIDCGPSRFTIWRAIRDETDYTLERVVTEIIRERGPPKEILMDNAATFRSSRFLNLLKRWRIKPIFRCANRPEGNGIIERNHRTIKRMAARTGREIEEMVYWYNYTPREVDKESSVPSRGIYKYNWRCPYQEQNKEEEEEDDDSYRVGDDVLVKPVNAKCTSEWKDGNVTGIERKNVVEVDGIPQHVSRIRRKPPWMSKYFVGDQEIKGKCCNLVAQSTIS